MTKLDAAATQHKRAATTVAPLQGEQPFCQWQQAGLRHFD
jgi:hypothetical protein